MSDKLFKPGQKAPRSGQYEITGPRGGGTGVPDHPGIRKR